MILRVSYSHVIRNIMCIFIMPSVYILLSEFFTGLDFLRSFSRFWSFRSFHSSRSSRLCGFSISHGFQFHCLVFTVSTITPLVTFAQVRNDEKHGSVVTKYLNATEHLQTISYFYI